SKSISSPSPLKSYIPMSAAGILHTNNASSPAPHTPDFFDLAPCSLSLEDYSGLRKWFDAWRADGVTDLRSFVQADPQRVAACSASIQILRVNHETLALYEAASQDDLTARLDEVLRDDMFNA